MDAKRNLFPVFMKAAAIITGAMTVVLSLINLFFSQSWLLTCLITAGTTCYHFCMRLIVGAFIPLFVKNTDICSAKWFQPHPFEQSVYSLLRVKSWKRHVPTYNPDSFDTQKHPLPVIIRNMCISELVHTVIILLSFLPIFAALIWGEFLVFAATSTIAAAVDCVFVLVQRFNRPRLARLIDKIEAVRHE